MVGTCYMAPPSMTGGSGGSIRDLAAGVEIKLAGTKLTEEEAATLLNVKVERGIHLPDRIELVFADIGGLWSNKRKPAMGSKVEVSLGYVESGLVKVGAATLAYQETILHRSGLREVHLVGYGPRYILQRGVEAKNVEDTSVDDYVNQATGGMGPSISMQQGDLSRPYFLQANQAGRPLLMEWASRLGLVVLEDDDNIKAAPPDLSADGPSFDFGSDLRDFRAEVNTFHQVSKVKVTAADPTQKTQIVAEAGPDKALDLMGGSVSGSKAAEEAFGEVVYEVSDMPVRSQAEADRLAEALYNDRLFSFVIGFGTAKGTPQLKAGGTVTLNKLGNKMSGKYYVTRVVHEYAVKEGFRSFFEVCRPAIGG